MAVETITPADAVARAPGTLRIDFLFLDLTSCDRCLGADRNLRSALEVVRGVLEATGVDVEVNRVLVESAEQAREFGFVTSPTIRVNGRDVGLELRESPCGSKACVDGCGDQIACRVWLHQGREYTEPPVAMIVDALLRRIYGGSPSQRVAEDEPYELPANLARFFTARTASPEPEVSECCPPGEQASCCEPSEKDDCCGTAAAGRCGCR